MLLFLNFSLFINNMSFLDLILSLNKLLKQYYCNSYTYGLIFKFLILQIPNDIYIIIAMVLPFIMKIRFVDIYHYIVKQIIIIYHSLKQFSEFMVLQKLRIKIEENEKAVI